MASIKLQQTFLWLGSLIHAHVYCRNNEIKFTGQFGERGVRYELHVPNGEDHVLSRQVNIPHISTLLNDNEAKVVGSLNLWLV